MWKLLVLHSADNIAVVTSEIAAGEMLQINERTFMTVQTIPSGHKMAIADIQPDEPILKYGEIIGVAKVAIALGEHVHTHNLRAAEV